MGRVGDWLMLRAAPASVFVVGTVLTGIQAWRVAPYLGFGGHADRISAVLVFACAPVALLGSVREHARPGWWLDSWIPWITTALIIVLMVGFGVGSARYFAAETAAEQPVTGGVVYAAFLLAAPAMAWVGWSVNDSRGGPPVSEVTDVDPAVGDARGEEPPLPGRDRVREPEQLGPDSDGPSPR